MSTTRNLNLLPTCIYLDTVKQLYYMLPVNVHLIKLQFTCIFVSITASELLLFYVSIGWMKFILLT